MKITFEVDITPEEVQELFKGNMDSLQRALIELFMRQMPKATVPDNDIMSFWQSMAERSSEMFEQYQKVMTGASGTSSSKKKT